MSRKFRLIFNPTEPVGIKWVCWEKLFCWKIPSLDKLNKSQNFASDCAIRAFLCENDKFFQKRGKRIFRGILIENFESAGNFQLCVKFTTFKISNNFTRKKRARKI